MSYNTQSIGDLIKIFLKKKGLDQKMQEIDLIENWEQVAGPMIANHTKNVAFKDGLLTLSLNSAALRHTLSFSKSDFIEKLNGALGKELIRDIVLK